jgi:hypothetical protein
MALTEERPLALAGIASEQTARARAIARRRALPFPAVLMVMVCALIVGLLVSWPRTWPPK